MKSAFNRRRGLLVGLVAFLCMTYLPPVLAVPESVTGYFTNETNECPEALRNMQKTGKWPGVTITPVQITYPGGNVCTLSNENQNSNVLYMTLSCPNDPKQSGEYGFSINGNELVMARKSERKSYIRCRNLSVAMPTDLPAKGTQNSGINVGGTKVRPFGNNSAMGMRMNAPF